MVAKQVWDSGPSFTTSFCPNQFCHDDATIIKLQEESKIKMFTNDPKLNLRLLLPTSLDGFKPSYVKHTEDLLTYLSVARSLSRSMLVGSQVILQNNQQTTL